VDYVVRSRRLLLTAGVAGLLACGRAGRDSTLVGVSAPRSEPEPTPLFDASASSPPSGTPTRAGMQRVSARFTSQGHGDAFEAEVWANAEGRAALDAELEARDGAVFVEEASHTTARGDPIGGRLVMEKRRGAWRFFVVEADADAAAESAASGCEACHRDAPRDHVFRLAAMRGPPQMHSAANSAAITATAPTAVAIPAATYDASSAGAAASPSR